MGLTDLSTLLFAIFLTFISTFGTALLWRNIYRNGFRNLFLRLFLIILCQVLAMASVGLAVNRSNGFFESWNDLFGSGSNYSAAAVMNSQLPKLSRAEISHAKKLGNGAVMVSDVITGKTSGISNLVYLYIPKTLKKELQVHSQVKADNFRVVEFLTGFPSQPIMWFKVMKIDQELARYNASHRKRQIIGIFPQVNVAGNEDLECMNLPNGKPKTETWLAEDMHSYLEKRVGAVDTHWSIMGLSTGGWCAAMLSVKHPELFEKAASIAGYYRPALPLTDPIALQNWAKTHYGLAQFEAMLPQKLNFYLVASLGDKYSIKETRKFLALNHPNLKIKYREIPSGGHNPHVWIPSIKPALDWL
jgi:hypothetical protein